MESCLAGGEKGRSLRDHTRNVGTVKQKLQIRPGGVKALYNTEVASVHDDLDGIFMQSMAELSGPFHKWRRG
jgi:hypothetical protein